MEMISKEKLKEAFFPAERVAVFIDGANLYGALKNKDFSIDYVLMRNQFTACGRLMRCFYYTGIKDNGVHDGVRKLADFLDNNGWNVISKPVKFQRTQDGDDPEYFMKANMDVEIAVDMIKVSAHVDHLVLFSGDGDFRYLLEYLKDRGKRITVISSIESTAKELRREADNWFELEAMRGLFHRDAKERMRANLLSAEKPPLATAGPD